MLATMPRFLLVCVMVVGVWAGEPAAAVPATILADQAVRYVNDDIITIGDIQERLWARRTQRPAPRPRDLIEDLTDERLFVQHADEMGVLLDPARIAEIVDEQARARGRSLPLASLARERRQFELDEKVRAVLRFFEGRTGQVSPSELWEHYQANQVKFRRTARARLHQIQLRAAEAREVQDLRKSKGALFKRAQALVDVPITDLVGPRIDAILAAPDVLAQDRLLDEVLTAMVALPAEGLGAAARELLREAGELLARARAARSPEQAVAELTTLRATLVGSGTPAFVAAAKAHSQGPRANEGGELGWIEPGTFTAEFDEQVFKLKSGELSPVFRIENTVMLVLVTEQQQAAQRSFAEVSGEIDATLRKKRQESIRTLAAQTLRKKATIRDLVDLDKLFQ